MKKKLYVVRHAETLFNIQNKMQGWSDSPITPKGYQQIEQCAKWFKDNNITIDQAYCSTAERTSTTLEAITDIPYTRLKGLRERGFGTYEGKDECLHPNRPWGNYYLEFGGESDDMHRERVVACFNEIIANSEGPNILVVSSAGSIGTMARYWEKNGRHPERLKNCNILIYEIENNELYFKEYVNPVTED